MSLNRYAVRVDPQGQAVTVDVLDTSGTSVAVYDSPLFAATQRTLPLVITTQTDFWLPVAGSYDVSCKVGGAEVADAGAPKRVELSDVPVLVVPDWERQRAASPGGSLSVVSKTANYTTTASEVVLGDASGGDFAVTLPAPADGSHIRIKNVGATGTVTVSPHAAETIDGASSYPLTSQYESRDFVSDGTDWWLI